MTLTVERAAEGDRLSGTAACNGYGGRRFDEDGTGRVTTACRTFAGE